MTSKLFTSVAWILTVSAWIGLVFFLSMFEGWGDGASSSFYAPSRKLAYALLYCVPSIVALLGMFSPYDWFPKKALRFACWPWSLRSFILSIVGLLICLALIGW